MQRFVGGIGHHESKRLYEKFASSPKIMRLAKWFNAVSNDNFPKFCEWHKGYNYRNTASESYSEFIYLHVCWRLWNPCFSVFSYMKTIVWKLSLWKPNSFIVLCIHVLNFDSKFLIERNIFPAFLTTQIDQLSPADSVLHRPWKAPKKRI